ncbi:MAG: stage II sporulation protein R [Eubacterium sp.]
MKNFYMLHKKEHHILMCAFALLLISTVYFTFIAPSYLADAASAQAALASKVIRFHVRANSDSDADQELKMCVKENVVSYIYENTTDINSLDEMREFLKTNDDTIKTIAKNTVLDNGYDYNISTSIDYSYFPDKTYGDYTFPEGYYEAYIIEIGSGSGHNWWCVLYPPLCFIDASTAVVPDSSKEILDDNTSENYSQEISYEFKYLTFLNDIF